MKIFFLLAISISILILGKTSKLYDFLCQNTGINNDILVVLKKPTEDSTREEMVRDCLRDETAL